MSRFWRAWALASIPLLLTLAYLAVANRGFFFQDDKQAQYAATYHFIGTELRQGHWPSLVPGLGTAGNFLLDAQYGLTNPIMWLQNVAFSLFSNLEWATLLMAGTYLLILQAGTVAWVLRLTDGDVAWSATAGATAWLSGYAIWWAGVSWHPALASLAILPWMAWAVASPSPGLRGLLLVTATTFAATAGGWPFTAVAAVVLVAANLLERWFFGSRRAAGEIALAFLGGLLLALPSYVFAGSVLDWTIRNESVANGNFLVPNLIDTTNTAIVSAASNMVSFGTTVVLAPTMLAGGLSIGMLGLLDYGRWDWRRPGTLTLVVTALLFLFGTQGPSDTGPLRFPFRLLGPWQLMVAVVLCTFCATLGLRLTRYRLLVAGGSILGFTILAGFRLPAQILQHLVAAALAAGLLVLMVRMARAKTVAAAVPVVLMVTVLSLFSVLIRPNNANLPDWGTPTEVSAYQAPLGATDRSSLVLYPDHDDKGADFVARFAAQGVFIGQNYLLSPSRSGLGYTPVGQKPLQPRMCTDVHGFTCAAGVAFLASEEPSTGQRWLDLLGTRTLVAHRSFVESLRPALARGWAVSGGSADFEVFSATTPKLPGRISHSSGSAEGIVAMSISDRVQTYEVAAHPTPRTLVFSDVYWPGYEAKYSGAPLKVVPLADSLVSVRIPAKAGELEITYRPAGTTAATILVALGIVCTFATAVLARRVKRRTTGPAHQSKTRVPII